MRGLKNIKFPVFPIPNGGTIEYEDFDTYYISTIGVKYLIDSKTQPGTFGLRRIRSNIKLLPLKRSILTLGSLILYAKRYKQFVDSNGKLFLYERKTIVPVKKRKIVLNVPYKNATMLFLENIHCPLIFYRPLKMNEEYALLALVSNGYILLGVSDNNRLKRVTLKV